MAIISLIAEPIPNKPLIEDRLRLDASKQLQERGKMIIEHMSWSMKAIVIIIDSVPSALAIFLLGFPLERLREIATTMFLMWTGATLGPCLEPSRARWRTLYAYVHHGLTAPRLKASKSLIYP